MLIRSEVKAGRLSLHKRVPGLFDGHDKETPAEREARLRSASRYYKDVGKSPKEHLTARLVLDQYAALVASKPADGSSGRMEHFKLSETPPDSVVKALDLYQKTNLAIDRLQKLVDEADTHDLDVLADFFDRKKGELEKLNTLGGKASKFFNRLPPEVSLVSPYCLRFAWMLMRRFYSDTCVEIL